MKILYENKYTTIHFKSKSYYFRKEESGIKMNTVRIVNKIEDEQIKRFYIDNIEIEDTLSGKIFTRVLTDITRFMYKDIIFYIFSWN